MKNKRRISPPFGTRSIREQWRYLNQRFRTLLHSSRAPNRRFGLGRNVCVPHNGNLLDSLSPNELVKGFRIISYEKNRKACRTEKIFSFIKEEGRNSIPLQYFEEVGFLVEHTLKYRVHYISILEKILGF